MIIHHRSEERGMTKLSWLESKHSFSFGDYYDPQHMGFGSLRVINEDTVDPAAGFGAQLHQDMEIITYVLEGSLEHRDTLGTSSAIKPGDIQCMSAGTGIRHSEYNSLKDEPVHFLQIWILPERKGLPPSHEQKNFIEKRKPGKLTLVASPDGRSDSPKIHQDATLFVLDLESDQSSVYELKDHRLAWVQVARGEIVLNGQILKQGDGAATTQEKTLEFQAKEKAEILIFDLTD